jgi:predicted secreted protein
VKDTLLPDLVIIFDLSVEEKFFVCPRTHVSRTNFVKYFFILLIVIVTCNPLKLSTNSDTNLGKSDNGKEVSFSFGTRLVIQLPCNVSTGYTWQVVQCDTSVIQETGEFAFVPDDTMRRGGPGTCSFPFKTVRKGQSEIRILYAPWWEITPVPIDSFRVSVVVQ